jgi:hypothetical protein
MEVPLEKTFVSIVRKQIRDESKSQIDFVALSSQGYSTAQELLALNKFYDLLRPDYVVLFFYTGNDFEDNLRREFAYLDPNGNLVFPENQISRLKQQFLSFKRWMYESSYLVFFFKNLLESYSAMNLGDESKNISARSKEYQFEITRKLVVEMKRFVEERGAEFGLVLFTNKHQMREGHLEKTEFIQHVCKEARIPYVEVTHELRPEHFFRADEHFTETGHRIVAERVYEYLARTFLRGDSAAHPNIQSRFSEMDESN